MDVLMIAQYFGNIEALDNSNNRFVYLASMLAEQHSVEVLTTSFVHGKKEQAQNIPSSYKGFKITALPEPGYMKNICLKRFHSHRVLATNMEKYLNTRKVPDVIYCAIPSLDCAYVAAKYAKKNGVPFIVDVQDLWPEAFKMVFKVPIIKDIVFYPMDKKADYVYAAAQHIIGVSQTYCKRAQKANTTAGVSSIFLGTNLEVFDYNAQNYTVQRNDQNLVLGYCGTLGHSYDLKCVLDAMQIVNSKGYNNVEFWVMGRGPLETTLQQYAIKNDLNVTFMGWLPYHKMCGMLSSCDVCVNPITKGAAQSIINKHADYAAAGLPVISTQESEEYQSLIAKYHCGINCKCADPNSVADAILYIAEHKDERLQMGKNSRQMAEALFDRKITYKQILDIIDNMVLPNKVSAKNNYSDITLHTP